MKRKDYQKPTMDIVKLQQQTHLLAGSGVKSMRSGYGSANSDVDEKDLEEGTETWLWN